MKNTLFRIPVFTALLAMTVFYSCTQKQELPGQYWKGIILEQFTLVLDLQEQHAIMYSYEGDFLFRTDTLSELSYREDSLVFFVPDMDIWFRSTLTGGSLDGVFHYTDGSRLEVIFNQKGREDLAELGLLPGTTPSRALVKRKYSPGEIHADIEEFARLLKAYHPGIYDLMDEAAFDAMITQKISGITDSLDILSAMPVFMQIDASLGCSHTRVRASAPVRRAMEYYTLHLPAELMIIDDALMTSGRKAGKEEVRQAQVLSLNGVPAEELMTQIYSVIPVSNRNKPAAAYEFNRFQSAYLPFILKDSAFSIELTGQDSESSVHHFEGVPVNDLSWIGFSEHPDWAVHTITGANAAILRIPTFDYPYLQQLSTYLDSLFYTFRTDGIENLIVDVRGNEGGSPFEARILLSYLIDKPFAYYSSAGEIPPSMADYSELFKTWPQSENVFKGRLVILSDAGCMSTTGHFIALIRYHKAGMVAGTPPESHYRSNGIFLEAKLPNTGIECNIPTARLSANVDGMDARQELKPDLPFDCCHGISLNDEDPLLEYVLEQMIEGTLK